MDKLLEFRGIVVALEDVVTVMLEELDEEEPDLCYLSAKIDSLRYLSGEAKDKMWSIMEDKE